MYQFWKTHIASQLARSDSCFSYGFSNRYPWINPWSNRQTGSSLKGMSITQYLAASGARSAHCWLWGIYMIYIYVYIWYVWYNSGFYDIYIIYIYIYIYRILHITQWFSAKSGMATAPSERSTLIGWERTLRHLHTYRVTLSRWQSQPP